MKRILVVLVIGLSLVMGSGSVWAADLSVCLKVTSPLDRLECYDRVSKRKPVVRIKKSDGKWKIHTSKSKMKDTNTVSIWVTSDNNISCKWGGGQKFH